MNSFDVGDDVRCTGTWTDAAGTALDPNAVFFQYEDPSGTVTSLAYPATIVKDGTGIYHVDIDCDEAGIWSWRWYSTGTGQAAAEGQFLALESRFV